MEQNSGKLRAKDLRIKHQCTKCQHWLTAHAVPWGEPLALLVTGYCGHCGASYLSLRDASESGIGGAAQQLSEYFLQAVPGTDLQDIKTKH